MAYTKLTGKYFVVSSGKIGRELTLTNYCLHSIVLARNYITVLEPTLVYGDYYTHFSYTDIEIQRDCNLPKVTKLVAGRVKV